MRAWIVLVVMCVVGFLAGSASGSDGSEIAPSSPTLWWHTDGDSFWMNTMQVDPAHSVETDGYNGLAYVAGLGTATFEIPMAPALTTATPLDPEGEVAFFAYPGGSGLDVGVIDSVDFTLTADGEVVSEATAAGPFVVEGAPVEITANGAVAMAEIPHGAELVWTIDFHGASGQVVLVGREGQWTRAELPIADAGASGDDEDTTGDGDEADEELPEFEEVTGQRLVLVRDFDTATSMDEGFNWTASDLTDPVITINASVSEGVWAAMLVYWPHMSDEYEGEYLGFGAEDQEIQEVVQGEFPADTWGLYIVYEDFVGTLDIDFGPAVVEEAQEDVDPVEGGDDEDRDEEQAPVQEADPAASGANDAPAVWAPLLAVGLLGLAARRRP